MMYFFLFKALIVLLLKCNELHSSKVYITPEGIFKDFAIYIKDDVPEGDGTLLKNIQESIQKASFSLLKATGSMQSNINGVQIGSVKIRVPHTWNILAEVDVTPLCMQSDLLITSERENNYLGVPFTKQLGSCGDPGEQTRYPFTFFTSVNKQNLDRKGKIIMNEFVKVRYGVFSEEPYRNMLTVFDGKTFIQSSCGVNFPWKLNNPTAICSLPCNSCQYTVKDNARPTYSVMFDSTTNENEYFCDDHGRPHNRLAKSLHNMKCDGQSISKIILRHEDFKMQRNSTEYQGVSFQILKGQNRKIVLLIDVSGSMSNILSNVIIAAVEFVNNVVEESADIGLVTFSSSATIVSNLLSMNDTQNKAKLAEYLRQMQSNGYTNIGDGLEKAVKVLGSDMKSLEKIGGTIFLLSDGENNVNPDLYNKYVPMIISRGPVVNTISYGKDADSNIIRLAKGTGGQFLFSDPTKPYTNLLDQFAERDDCQTSFTSPIKVFEKSLSIRPNESNFTENLAYLDPFIGKDLLITATSATDLSTYKAVIVDPNNKTYSFINKIIQTNSVTLVFKIPGQAKIGVYKMRLEVSFTNRVKREAPLIDIKVSLSAIPDKDSERIINPTAQLSLTEISSVNGTTVVVAFVDLSSCGIKENEEVDVVLRVSYPNQKEILLPMYDNGLGYDVVAADNVFSAALTYKQLSDKGFYIFQAKIEIKKDKLNPIFRTVDFATLKIDSVQSGTKDEVPPATINSLNLTIVESKLRILKVSFLATGDDGLMGNISRYQIFVQTNNETSFIINITSFTQPQQIIETKLNLFDFTTNIPFQIKVRGIDEMNNAGEWSYPEVFSWDYDDIFNKYSKSSHSLNHGIFLISIGIIISKVF